MIYATDKRTVAAYLSNNPTATVFDISMCCNLGRAVVRRALKEISQDENVNSSHTLKGGASTFAPLSILIPSGQIGFVWNFRFVLHPVRFGVSSDLKVKPFAHTVESSHRRIDAKFGCSLRT